MGSIVTAFPRRYCAVVAHNSAKIEWLFSKSVAPPICIAHASSQETLLSYTAGLFLNSILFVNATFTQMC